MPFSADKPVWALVNKSNNTFISTQTGIKTFETRAAARAARVNDEQVRRLDSQPASYNYR